MQPPQLFDHCQDPLRALCARLPVLLASLATSFQQLAEAFRAGNASMGGWLEVQECDEETQEAETGPPRALAQHPEEAQP
jgi:hypothetical protein